MTDAELKAFAVVMQEMHIHRFSGEEEGESFCIEMEPSAIAPRATSVDPSPLPPEREPTAEEIAFASSIPVTDAERGGRDS